MSPSSTCSIREIVFDFLNNIACVAKINSKFLIANQAENISGEYLCGQYYE